MNVHKKHTGSYMLIEYELLLYLTNAPRISTACSVATLG